MSAIQPNAIGSVVPLFSGGSGSGAPSGAAGGDLDGTYPNPTVDGLQGNPVSAVAPAGGEVLTWNGLAWAPATPAGGAVITSAAGAWTVTAAEVVGDVVYATGAFTALQADNSASATTPGLGVVIAKPTAITATLAYMGEVAVFAGLTPGAEYYLGLLGAITTTAPVAPGSVVQRVGIALSATVLLVKPDPTEVVL